MRIVSIGERSTCRHYRSTAPVQGLCALGHQAVYVDNAPADDLTRATVSVDELAAADVILGYRLLYSNLPIVRAAMAKGAAFVWDTDDDLANLPRESSTFKTMRAKGLQRLVAHCSQLARAADVVTTTTGTLAAKYDKIGAKQIAIIPNFLPEGSVKNMKRKRRDEVVIGWIAGAEHKVDLRKIPVVKALRRLLVDYPQVRIESAGIQLPLPEDRYRHYSWVLADRLPALFAQWDIGIAPLTDIPFNRARSDVKLKEYGGSGLPWLASPVGPYADKTKEQGGWLVPDDEWYEALSELVEEPFTRQELGAFAFRWAQSQLIARRENARLWEQACQAAIERRSERLATV